MLSDIELDILAERVAERLHTDVAFLLLHSMPEAFHLGGIVVDPEIVGKLPCTCYKDRCFSKGVIGALTESERSRYCHEYVDRNTPAIEKRLDKWDEVKLFCDVKSEGLESGDKLTASMFGV